MQFPLEREKSAPLGQILSEKGPKRDNFSEKVSLRNQSLLKETELGALLYTI